MKLWPRTLTIPRAPDFVVGDNYLRRWWLIPRNRFFNVYLHNFLHSDEDRALHTHPYANVSILLRGNYLEHLEGGRIQLRKPWRPWAPWRVVFRRPSPGHRIELINDAPVWSLFITGPRVCEWFFLCPQGRIHWRDFTSPGAEGQVGKGCDQ